MTTALEIVDAMLEAPLEEAVGTNYVRVFGPNVPEKGYFFTGPDPLVAFFKSERKDANPTSRKEVNSYIDYFTKQGFVIWQKKGRQINVWHHPNIKPNHLTPDQLQSLEDTHGLNQNSIVMVNRKPVPASQFIYAQKLKQSANAPQQQAVSPQNSPTGIARQKQMTLAGTFGGLQSTGGSYQPIYKVNHNSVQTGLKSGLAYVFKYPNGGINVVTPKNYQFSRQAIQGLEKNMGITPRTLVHWFQNNITQGKAVAASVAIYRQPAAAAAPKKTP